LRVVPGSQWSGEEPPDLIAEPDASKKSVLCPLPPGSAIVRDLRTWHGGTPNLLDQTRYLPNAEFVDGEMAAMVCGRGGYLDPCSKVLPMTAYRRLSSHGRKVTEGIADRSGALKEVNADSPVSEQAWLKKELAQFSRHSPDSY